MGWTDAFNPISLLKSGGGMIDSFLHPERGYEEAQKQAEKHWQEAQGYEKPYWQQGLDQYGRLNEATGKLMDPSKLQNEWGQGYETSPYAKRMLQMNQGQGLDAASSMGLMGSSGALSNIQQGAGDIVAKDRQQYMDDLMKKYMTGIGLGSDIYGHGARAGETLAGGAMGHGQNMAELAYGKTNAPGNLLGGFAGMAGKAAINYMMPGSGAATGAAGGGGGTNRFNQ